MSFLGIDPSTKTGICILQEGKPTTRVIQYAKDDGIKRLQLIADEFESLLETYDIQAAVIEGYAYGNKFSLALMVEIGVIFRLAMHRRGIKWYIAPPSLLKRYVSGSGVADKKRMARAVNLRWGAEFPSDDVVDAYGLARIAEDLGKHGVTANTKGVLLG